MKRHLTVISSLLLGVCIGAGITHLLTTSSNLPDSASVTHSDLFNVPCSSDSATNGQALINTFDKINNIHPNKNSMQLVALGACTYQLPSDLTISPFIRIKGTGPGDPPFIDSHGYLDANNISYGNTTIDTHGHVLTIQSPSVVNMTIINTDQDSSIDPVVINNTYYDVGLSNVGIYNYGGGNAILMTSSKSMGNIDFIPDQLMIYTSKNGKNAMVIDPSVSGTVRLVEAIIDAPNSNPTGILLLSNNTKVQFNRSQIYGGTNKTVNPSNFSINSSFTFIASQMTHPSDVHNNLVKVSGT